MKMKHCPSLRLTQEPQTAPAKDNKRPTNPKERSTREETSQIESKDTMGMQTVYDGSYPADFRPSKKEGGIVLGVGGDNSPWGSGTWFEGVMTKGFSTAETDAAVFANVVAAGYIKLN